MNKISGGVGQEDQNYDGVVLVMGAAVFAYGTLTARLRRGVPENE